MNIYNYALDSMYPFEYRDYLNFAKSIKGNEFKYVIIGADFYNTRYRTIKRFENPSYYITETKSFMYRYKMLLSKDLLNKSFKIIRENSTTPSPFYYINKRIKIRDKVSENARMSRYTTNIIRHTNSFSDINYQWNERYFDDLKKIKQENPNTKFIIFTSPISADLFVSIIKNTNKLKQYQKWIHELVNIFGEIYCFMDISSVTTNLQNYPDDDHFYPYIGKILATKIATKKFNIEPTDFGVIVNHANVNEFLKNQKEKIESYKFSTSYPKEEIKHNLNIKER